MKVSCMLPGTSFNGSVFFSADWFVLLFLCVIFILFFVIVRADGFVEYVLWHRGYGLRLRRKLLSLCFQH